MKKKIAEDREREENDTRRKHKPKMKNVDVWTTPRKVFKTFKLTLRNHKDLRDVDPQESGKIRV